MKHKNHNTKKYPINENYFETIDTEEKAYWLGFMYADGCVTSTCNKINLCLTEKDHNHLEKFKKSLNFGGIITKRPAKQVVIRNKIVNCKPIHVIAFSSKKMKNDLINAGCFSNKSLTLKFPNSKQVPDHLINHFIRGYFDGDGWFCKGKPKHKNNRVDFQMGLVSSKEFVEMAKIFIFNQIGVNMTISQLGKVYRLTLRGNVNCKKLSNFLFENSNIFLKRKYKLYKEVQALEVLCMSGENSCLASRFKVINDNNEIIEINNASIFSLKNNKYNDTGLSHLKNGIIKKYKDLRLYTETT